MSFDARRTACAAKIETHLSDAIGRFDPSLPFVQAMQYAVRGGKRLRGFLVMDGARLYGVDDDVSVVAGAAIEAMHAYSLVHDDLPAMDDDDLRRGQPTVHRKWDEATAILAGDALQTLAFALVGSARVEADRAVDLTTSLAAAAGAGGMVMGQALDIAAETAGQALSLDEIVTLQEAKTGQLLRWSATAGPRMAAAPLDAMTVYGESIGLAFQIADDILDVTGDEAQAGKRLRKDAEAGKATFVSLLGLHGARVKAAEMVERAVGALSDFGAEADTLREAARFVTARNH